MGRVAIFIDGGYLDKVVYYNHHNSRIDYEKLASAMAAPDELLRTYYYHCLPYQSNPPTEEEKQRFSGKQRFYYRLGLLPKFQVRLGKLVYRGTNQAGERIFVQKRVDTMVGVDMALLAGKARITRLILLSGDSDLIPAIEAVKAEGVSVTLWHGAKTPYTAPSVELFNLCDERRELTGEIARGILRA